MFYKIKNELVVDNSSLTIRNILEQTISTIRQNWRALLSFYFIIAILLVIAFSPISIILIPNFQTLAKTLITTSHIFKYIIPICCFCFVILLLIITVTSHYLAISLITNTSYTTKELLKTSFCKIFYVIVGLVNVTILIFTGFLFFVIPGLILAASFSFWICILLFEELGPIESMIRSRQYCKGRFSTIFKHLLFLTLINAIMKIMAAIISSLLSSFLFLLCIPIYTIYNVTLYYNIKLQSPEYALPSIKQRLIYIIPVIITLTLIIYFCIRLYLSSSSQAHLRTAKQDARISVLQQAMNSTDPSQFEFLCDILDVNNNPVRMATGTRVRTTNEPTHDIVYKNLGSYHYMSCLQTPDMMAAVCSLEDKNGGEGTIAVTVGSISPDNITDKNTFVGYFDADCYFTDPSIINSAEQKGNAEVKCTLRNKNSNDIVSTTTGYIAHYSSNNCTKVPKK